MSDYETIASLRSQNAALRKMLTLLQQQLHIAQRHDGAFETCRLGNCPDVLEAVAL